jgi:DNA-binding SARP family transcriptional activator
MIELRALGKAEIRTESAILTPAQDIAFAAALYLVVERGKPLSRSKLMSLLWPDVDASARSHRLRQTIYHLKASGVVARSDRQVLTLPRDHARSDVDDLSSTCGINNHLNIEFLPGYHPRHSDAFEAWLDGVRENVHSALTRSLIVALREARNGCNWVEVEIIARQCLHLDPYNEAAVLARAEAYAMRGQKAAALSILNHFVEDVSPNERALVLPAAVLRRRILGNDEAPLTTRLASNDPEFVGRADEMRMLSQLIERTRNGRGGGCLLVGEPGIGKTRLSVELAKFAELQGFKVERVSCKRSDIDQPLSALVNLVPALRQLPGALGCSQETLAWLTRLTEFNSFPKAPESPTDDSSAIYTHLRSAVFDLLDAISEESSVLVIVEDVQWLDRASTKLFGAILDWAASKQLFLLFNARGDSPPLREAVLTTELPVVPVGPLAADDAACLARTFANEAADLLHDPTVTWFINVAEGNPYFLQELIKHRIESGHRHTIPPSVARVLDDRLSRLSEVARHLLQACAVLHENSDIDRLERVLEYPPHQLLAGIQELSASGMLRATSLGSENRTLSVRHDLLANQVLIGLAPGSLAYLHRRCALILEREALGTSTSISLLRACAFHSYQAGDHEKAYSLALKCADHLLELGLASDAERAFESALGFSNSQEKHLEVLTRIVQAMRMARDWKGQLYTIGRIRAIQNSNTTIYHDDLELIELEALGKTVIDLATLLERTVGCVRDSRLSPSHRVSVAGIAAKLASGIPDLDTLEDIYHTVHPLLESADVHRRDRLQLEVVYHTMCGDLKQAVSFAKERVVVEREAGTVSTLVNSLTDLAYVLRRTGPEEEMFDALRQGYDTALHWKHYASARACAQRIASLLEDEEIEGSVEWMRLSAECFDATEVYASFSYNADAARIALREGRLTEARSLLETGFDWEWLSHRRIWLAAVTGLRIRLLVAEAAVPAAVAPPVTKMLELYPTIAALGRQDYEIGALEKGLSYLGEKATARECLIDYVCRRRRDLTPLSIELSGILQRYGLTAQSSALLRSERATMPGIVRLGEPVSSSRG